MGGFSGSVLNNGESEIVDETRIQNLMRVTIDVFRNTARPLMTEFGQETAESFIDELKFRISSQAFNHAALKPEYRIDKIRQRLDPRILIATGEYLDSFESEPIEDENGRTVAFRCGVRRGIHQPSGLPYRVLARIHEFGAFRRGKLSIPARPHWRPMASIFRNRAPELGRDLRARLVRRVHEGIQS